VVVEDVVCESGSLALPGQSIEPHWSREQRWETRYVDRTTGEHAVAYYRDVPAGPSGRTLAGLRRGSAVRRARSQQSGVGTSSPYHVLGTRW
jgi:hypothetical protein